MVVTLFVGLCLLVVTVDATPNYTQGKQCKVLALSGGGDKGAYEAGVVSGLVNNLPGANVTWDVVTGISAGAINSAAIATYAVGDEKAMADFLLTTARSLRADMIFKKWPLGDLQGIAFETGIYNSAPLLSFIKSHTGRGLTNRKIVVGATSYTTGLLETWNETLGVDELAIGVHASASIPGVFQTTVTRGDSFGDGGVKQGVNILDGIARCLEDGTIDPANVVVDIILCDGDHIKPIDPKGDKTITVLMRALSITRFKSSLDRIIEAKNAYPTTHFRYQIYPTAPLPGKSDLDFGAADLLAMTKIGIADAVKAIAKYNTTH